MKECLRETEIFKGQTLIINLNTIEMIDDEDYTFQSGDVVRIALKSYASSNKNVLYTEINPVAGQKSCSATFPASETEEKLEVDSMYILQADLVTNSGTLLPMLLQTFKVIGRAIIPPDEL